MKFSMVEYFNRDLVFNYDKAITQFRDTGLISHPRILNLQHSRKLTNGLSFMNLQVLPLLLKDAQNMKELQLIVYYDPRKFWDTV